VRGLWRKFYKVRRQSVRLHWRARPRHDHRQSKAGSGPRAFVGGRGARHVPRHRDRLLSAARQGARCHRDLVTGVTGFCWGGGTTNFFATTFGADLKAGVPFYGAAAETAAVPAIEAALLIQYAENDERINAMWPTFEAALKASNVQHEMHMYAGTQHGTTRRRGTTRPRPSWPGSGQLTSSRGILLEEKVR
jgi:dienelactone hydrolase